MSILSFLSSLLSPKPMPARSECEQADVDKQTFHLQLYDMGACPFCIKVRREITRLNLNIKVINAQLPENKSVLLEQGGQTQVPCLRIDNNGQISWLYESSAIIGYLKKHFNK